MPFYLILESHSYCMKDNSVAIYMPALGKSDIFEFVSQDLVLPRKSFSMGHASEKRYYLEAKKIVK